jgi:hypothetical protein
LREDTSATAVTFPQSLQFQERLFRLHFEILIHKKFDAIFPRFDANDLTEFENMSGFET